MWGILVTSVHRSPGPSFAGVAAGAEGLRLDVALVFGQHGGDGAGGDLMVVGAGPDVDVPDELAAAAPDELIGGVVRRGASPVWGLASFQCGGLR